MTDQKLICPYCGGHLTNQGEDLASNIKLEYQGDTTAKVHYLECDQCHRDYEVYDPKSTQKGQSPLCKSKAVKLNP
jgi:transposase